MKSRETVDGLRVHEDATRLWHLYFGIEKF